jgi:predicted metal-dependent peptidase
MARKKTSEKNTGTIDEKAIVEKLITARIGLLVKQPFFGSMATRLNLIRADDIDTAATDGQNFFYNVNFISGLTPQETEFLFGHEVLHNAFEHHIRRSFPDNEEIANPDGTISNRSRHHMLWNIACDYAVNEILVESKIGHKIDKTLYDPKYKGLCAEEIYDLLLQNADKIDIEELADMLLDEHISDLEKKGKGLSEGEKQKIREDIRENLLSSAQNSAGYLPKGVERLVGGITNPIISWRDELRMDIQSVVKYDYTFSNPNKKGMQYGVVLPGMKRDVALDVCIAIDTSGSIDEKTLNVFFSEIQGIMDQYDDYQIRIWSFDAEVHNEQIFRSEEGDDIHSYKPAGGGGTLFEANWDHMKKHDINPSVLIIFTDMYPCSGWGDETYCEDVIFVGYKSDGRIAPFGKTITIDKV